jgi:DNA-binding MarR family transcriptional regulator
LLVRKGCSYAIIVLVEPATTSKAASTSAGSDAEIHEIAARLGALISHIFISDRGEQLRVMEESGLSITQIKTLLALAGPGETAEPRQITEIGEQLGLSPPTVSRAVDGMVRKRLISRVEDEEDRRVRRIAITAKGEQLVGKLVSLRLANLERFASSLTAAQRRKLGAALESMLEREEIAATYSALKEASSR